MSEIFRLDHRVLAMNAIPLFVVVLIIVYALRSYISNPKSSTTTLPLTQPKTPSPLPHTQFTFPFLPTSPTRGRAYHLAAALNLSFPSLSLTSGYAPGPASPPPISRKGSKGRGYLIGRGCELGTVQEVDEEGAV